MGLYLDNARAHPNRKKLVTTQLHIEGTWQNALAAAGLDTFDALMESEQGKCVSRHDRGQTYRITLGDGETIFLKRDTFTSLKDILMDFSALRRPQPACMIELAAIRRVRELGIAVPEPIAWAQRPVGIVPYRAVLVMRKLPGTALSELLKTDPPQEKRQAAMQAAGRSAGRLYRAGLSWPDIAPKHFFVDAGVIDSLAGILDLARMREARLAKCLYMPKQIGRFISKLRARGGSDADEQAFMEGFGAQVGTGS